jgi:hypothetical protein
MITPDYSAVNRKLKTGRDEIKARPEASLFKEVSAAVDSSGS